MREDFTRYASAALGSALLTIGLICICAGCAWDNSPPRLHSVLELDRNHPRTALAQKTSDTNLPTSSDWETNQLQGAGAAGFGAGGGVVTGSGVGAGAQIGTNALPIGGTATSLPRLGATGSTTNIGTTGSTTPGLTPSSTPLGAGITNLPSIGTSTRTNSFGSPQ